MDRDPLSSPRGMGWGQWTSVSCDKGPLQRIMGSGHFDASLDRDPPSIRWAETTENIIFPDPSDAGGNDEFRCCGINATK